ncbi:cobalt-precorrin-6A reductase [Agrobacterium sp. a22-2]|uniref:cobalt-precorrin-6A reductase n=1 Tax=Agrobacterium sp. a22-2 TaxID=2283840 RepID=UPI001444CC34|nr:cobalt-precorrin-6A reductase [Agrobacterium sp. a22-2]NKN37850.1 cobalt-precorrin-6A reductase [Agrobacterium sp. a22-2]
MPLEKILILGGTAEAADLAARLVAQGGAEVTTSLAGRTKEPAPLAGVVRIGGFGGIEGLAAYLRANGISKVIDATHPFATRISENARAACALSNVPLEVLTRNEWRREPGDRWLTVDTLDAAVEALPLGATVFLALGRQHIAAFAGRADCRFVIRMIDRPVDALPLPDAVVVLGKASSDPDAERALFESHSITCLVARNSGGAAGYGKIAAARQMGIDVVMVGRPAP